GRPRRAAHRTGLRPLRPCHHRGPPPRQADGVSDPAPHRPPRPPQGPPRDPAGAPTPGRHRPPTPPPRPPPGPTPPAGQLPRHHQPGQWPTPGGHPTVITRLDRHLTVPIDYAADLLDTLDLLSEVLRYAGDELRHDIVDQYQPGTYDYLIETV